MENEILTYIDLNGIPTLVGHLWVHSKQNRQSISFEYDRTWLKVAHRFSLDPALQLSEGAFHASMEKPLLAQSKILRRIAGDAYLCNAQRRNLQRERRGIPKR